MVIEKKRKLINHKYNTRNKNKNKKYLCYSDSSDSDNNDSDNEDSDNEDSEWLPNQDSDSEISNDSDNYTECSSDYEITNKNKKQKFDIDVKLTDTACLILFSFTKERN